MFFHKYEIKDKSVAGKRRKIAVCAMVGERPKDDYVLEEKEGFQETFTTSVDYTTIPGFDLDTYKEVAEQHLMATLRDYDLVPSTINLDYLEGQFRKALGKAYMKNKLKKQFLAHQMEKIEEEQAQSMAVLVEEAESQLPKKIIAKVELPMGAVIK